MGEVPQWYPLYRAARWLGVTPEWLHGQPKLVMLRALQAEAAENRAAQGPEKRTVTQ